MVSRPTEGAEAQVCIDLVYQRPMTGPEKPLDLIEEQDEAISYRGGVVPLTDY